MNEIYSSAKSRLLDLEAKDKYVFHGSSEVIELFEPRQALNYIKGIQEPDGEPAVFASNKAEYAIFMAIIHEKNCPESFRSGAGTINGKLSFYATQETLDQLDEKSSGWVYVFDKKNFILRDKNGVEFVSTKPVTPIHRMKVNKKDLPENIEVTEKSD